MIVKEAVAELLKQNQEDEFYMFYKTKDGKLTFISEITDISHGAICDEYGNLIKGVLALKSN